MKEELFQDSSTGRPLAERRSGVDRRQRSLLAALFQRGPRRRKSAGRRRTDSGGYVDIYDFRTWAVAVAVLLLSLMDGLLTGLHLLRGSAAELNPVMNAVLRLGGFTAFFGLKALMTILPMAIIVLHKEWALGRYAARLCLWSYILVSLYHFYLIFTLRAFGSHPCA
jgi:hypothetical protein